VITQRSPYVLLLFISFLSLFLFFIQREISAVSQPIAAKLCHILEMGAILKTSSKFWDPPSKKICGPNNILFGGDFERLLTSIANISGTEQDIDNRKTAFQTTVSPASADVIW